jgi:carboxylesterase
MFFALFAALIASAIWRHRHLKALEAITYVHRRLGDDGIVIGGGPLVIERAGAPAILLLHGAGDTTQSLRYLATALHARGFHVAVPLLPGHGRTVRDFNRITADALTNAALANYDALRVAHEWVGVIGLSMGGALAVQLAAERTDIPAVALLAPYLTMPKRIERAAMVSHLWGPILPIVRSTEGKSVLDPDEQAQNLAYGVFTPGALRALRDTMRRAVERLPRVQVPTLVIQSREDNRITPADAERAFRLIGSSEKRLEWITGAAHIITVDYGRDAVFARLAAFMESHAPPRARVARRVTSDS